MTPQDEHEDRPDTEGGPDPQDRPSIEAWYLRFAKAAEDGTNPPGQEAQGAIDVTAEDLVLGFAKTVDRHEQLRGTGAFYPDGDRDERLRVAKAAQAVDSSISNTTQMVAVLKEQDRCEVVDRPELGFTYVDREIVAGRGLVDGAPAFQTDTRLSLDVLAVTDDGVPVVVELKVEGDQNARYGLIQALASAAQLAPAAQRARLREVYPNEFPARPEQLDVAVVRFRPNAASKPREALADQARGLLSDLRANHAGEGWVLHPQVRRIHLFTADVDGHVVRLTLDD